MARLAAGPSWCPLTCRWLTGAQVPPLLVLLYSVPMSVATSHRLVYGLGEKLLSAPPAPTPLTVKLLG
jgi:hypothetical protein